MANLTLATADRKILDTGNIELPSTDCVENLLDAVLFDIGLGGVAIGRITLV